MISVCMAVYNGEQFLDAQLRSILSQLAAVDELVLVDDASTDCSKIIIDTMNDPRIRYLRNEHNLGALKSFERALAAARGDIIFFADQDDLWLPDKLEQVVACFAATDALAVVTDAMVTDKNGAVTRNSYFSWRNSGPGLLKNFYKSTFLGCCMAVRSECKAFLLPFPATVYMHDQWVGLACTLLGRVHFLQKVLLSYRRHDSTVTRMQPSGLLRIIRLRLFLSVTVLLLFVRLAKWRLLGKPLPGPGSAKTSSCR